MRPRNPYLLAALVGLALLAGLLFWPRHDRADRDARNAAQAERQAASGKTGAAPAQKVPGADGPRPLYGRDPIWQIPEGATPPRRVMTDAEVLAKGRVLPVPGLAVAPAVPARSPASPSAAPVSAPVASVGSATPGGLGRPPVPAPVVAPVAAAAPSPVDNRPHSIHAADWKNKVNQLVSALRAGKGAEIDHALMMDFLQGKDLQGWSPDYRNWIGDELMIVLVKDLPERAFGDLKTIQENPAAPAAMRDYSVQHIGDLVGNGTINQAGVDYIWQTLAQNDPATASTALVILHRLSEQKPALVPAARVAEAAQKLLASADQRSQITAKSILRK